MNPAQAKGVELIEKRQTTASVTLVRVNADALHADSLVITLPDATTIQFLGTRVDARSPTDFTWSGEAVSSDFPSTATLVVHAGEIIGTIRATSLYQIEPLGQGVHALVEVDESRFPPEAPPLLPQKPGSTSPEPHGIIMKSGHAVIDVLVAYTPAARAAVPKIDATIQLAIAEANQSYRNSGIDLHLELVDSFEIDYSESRNGLTQDVWHFYSMASVHDRRDASGADVAVLLVSSPGSHRGVALTVGATASTAFAAVEVTSATGIYVFAHEIGHLQGARHNHEIDPTSVPFAYGHGYRHLSPFNSWRTIMAYDCLPSCARQVQYWSNPRISFNGIAMGTPSTNDNARVLNETAHTVAAFRERRTGWIRRFTGTPCSGDSCSGWEEIDRNPDTARIATSGGKLYQLQLSGNVWRFTDEPCSGRSCPGWEQIDNNAFTKGIFASGDELYQLQGNGFVWRFTGRPCSSPSLCSGWQMLDNNNATMNLAAGGDRLYQLQNNGFIWRYTGDPCSGNLCSGWQMLDNNNATVAIAAGGGGELYQLHANGAIWRFTGVPCSRDFCSGWQMLDNNSATVAIAAGDSELYQLRTDGTIWQYTGTPCGNLCWRLLDSKPSVINIVASGSELYQLHANGETWRYTGRPCSSFGCHGWQKLHHTGPGRMVADGSALYRIYLKPTPASRQRVCFDCR